MFRHLLFYWVFLCCALPGNAQLKRFTFSQPKMGSPFQLIFYDTDSAMAVGKAQQCFQLVDSLVLIFSDYIDSSELNRLCVNAVNQPVKLSPALFDILWQSKQAFKKSNGSFDITLGPITRLWRKARKEKIFPADALVKEKLSLTGFNKITIDSVAHTAMLSQSRMQLDLGGIAQGYIAQKVIDFLKTEHIDHALVDVSGDIVCTGAPPGTGGWIVGINVPENGDELLNKTLLISNNAVTTSGDVYQYMEHNGKRYSHIVDPKTGYGITSQRNVTVIAGDGTSADWLTKACSLLTVKKAKKLAHTMGAELLIAEIKKERIILQMTSGFKKYWKQ